MAIMSKAFWTQNTSLMNSEYNTVYSAWQNAFDKTKKPCTLSGNLCKSWRNLVVYEKARNHPSLKSH